MKFSFVILVSLDGALCWVSVHILDIPIVIDVRVDLSLSDYEFKLIYLKAELSCNLSAQVAKRLEVADVHAVRDAVLWVHVSDHIDFERLDVGEPGEDLLLLQDTDAFVAVQEECQELSHCFFVLNGR